MAGYGTDDGLATWLEDNGYVLPNGAPQPAILRQRASVYIDGLYGPRFSGYPTAGFEQERAWPRSSAYFGCSQIPTDLIPRAVIEASYAAAYYEAINPGGLSAAVTAAGAVKREKIDVIEVEYFQGSGSALENATVVLSSVEGLLTPFFSQAEAGIFAV